MTEIRNVSGLDYDAADRPVAHREALAAAAETKWLVSGALLVVLGLAVRSAWACDDAYVTLRTLDNWLHGFGLRWNVDERVQAYTHPLWLFLLGIPYSITRQGYFSLLASGLLVTLGALLLLTALARTPGHALCALLLLASSRFFVEFSTSGLENPLTHCLLASFVLLYLRGWGLRRLALVAALLALDRSDALLLVLPALADAAWARMRLAGARRTALELGVGFLPLLLWEGFSIFYYGSAVPNTAVAKLETGIPEQELLRQGATYLVNAIALDPPLLIVTALGVALGALGWERRRTLLALGAVVYLGYVLWIGGDFMSGRFFTAPLFLAACLIAVAPLPLERPAVQVALVAPFALLFFHPSAKEPYAVGDFRQGGIADERTYYSATTALMFNTRRRAPPTHEWVDKGREARAHGDRYEVTKNVGFMGYYGGPDVHWIDENALTDPFLARLPARNDLDWRVGHYARELPQGYLETLRTGRCRMRDRKLCRYFGELREIVAGKLWSWQRFKSIIAMQLGEYDDWIDRDRYRYPERVQRTLAELGAPVAESSPHDAAGTCGFGQDGIEIRLGRPSRAHRLALSLNGEDRYELSFRARGREVARAVSPALFREGMRTRWLEVPTSARDFDALVVRPLTSNGKYAIGYLRLAE